MEDESEPKEGNLVFISNENERFVVPFKAARLSGTALHLIEDLEAGTEVEFEAARVSSATLKEVVEFCTHYAIEPMKPLKPPLSTSNMAEIVQKWYVDFAEQQSGDDMRRLMAAASYLDIAPLLDLCGATIASWVKGKSLEEIEKKLGIVDGKKIRAEAEAAVRRKYAWARDL